MLKRVSAMKARQNLGLILNEVSLLGDDFIIERDGKPLAAVIPLESYRKLEALREHFFTAVDELRERVRDVDPATLQAEIDEAVQAAKDEQRGARNTAERTHA